MRQYRNEVNGLSLMERVVIRKSGTLSISPKCCGITISSNNQRPTPTEPVKTIGSHHAPSTAPITNPATWKAMVIRAKRTALRSLSGLVANRALAHSLAKMPVNFIR